MVDPSSVTSMSSNERILFEQVAVQCHDDVSNFCDDSPVSFLSFPPPPPMLVMNDLGAIVESMMRSVVEDMPQVPIIPAVHQEPSNNERKVEEQPVERPSEGTFVVFHSSSVVNNPCEEMFVRQMLSHFAPLIAPEETQTLAEKLAEHGSVMLERLPEDGSNEFRMARRLSEVTHEEVLEHRRDLFLPFGPSKNECLFQIYQERRASIPCGNALATLEQDRAARFNLRLSQREEELDAYAKLSVMYFFIFCTAVVLYCFRRNALVKQAGRNPLIIQRMKSARLLTVIVFSAMSILCILGYLPASVLLQACVYFSAFVFVRAVLTSTCDEEATCACCCCGASPQDAEYGNLTEAQACCGCCGGTGACGDQCASCCGPDGCCGADCCANGCCGGAGGCCCGNSSPDYKLMTDDCESGGKACCKKDAKMTGCCGADCCAKGCCGGAGGCCCCSLSKKDVKSTSCCGADCCANGCCGGAGGCCCCSGSCPSVQKEVKSTTCCGADCCANGCCGGAGGCCCCSESCPGNKQKKVVNRQQFFLYEGVPVQIV
mmetsp:Transcript_5873/g.12367  ORF Transcript_5873/g.12367 Transcript_5873/m.12367 type:complete len:546 (-) Transcript_5873:213-1850(-)|eukprot:CAMPEP_0172448416 /NCGR_PEP_ID=MMETSP1065-20121228/7433_1 /TAXON_ID=265537 /ORGANISM="Amphiprora paludosa, Strain CCMP125" /LENGTH=545 /DNA_ID=CAMNT_0013199905 /DNA_START=104 /DNA_END=1741 /DNA_ORIENTATION=+